MNNKIKNLICIVAIFGVLALNIILLTMFVEKGDIPYAATVGLSALYFVALQSLRVFGLLKISIHSVLLIAVFYILWAHSEKVIFLLNIAFFVSAIFTYCLIKKVGEISDEMHESQRIHFLS